MTIGREDGTRPHFVRMFLARFTIGLPVSKVGFAGIQVVA
jgi:hypothetical protein